MHLKRDIHKELSLKFGLPVPVIREVCYSPWRFTAAKMADTEDDTTIRYAYLGKIKIKKRYLLEHEE